MSKTLEEIRKKLQALDNRKGGNFTGGDKATYAHWNIAEGTSCTLRFLPDANEDNTFFWTERQIIKLPFAGIKGQDESKRVEVQVPCIEMFDGAKTCPILNEVRPWWKDKSLEDTARKYWVKRAYYMQGFVKVDPMNEDSPDNPIRKFVIGPQLFATVKAALLDPEMEHSPVHIINGLDFIVNKTSKGGYADYATSKWARKESSITEDMQEAIDQYGLVDLKSYLPKKPTQADLAIMYEMFQASLDGDLYDPEKWATFYKPFGFDSGTSSSKDADEDTKRPTTLRPAPTPTPTKVAPVADPDLEEAVSAVESAASTAPATTGKSPQEILQMLRNRKQ